jgi:endonuclease-3
MVTPALFERYPDAHALAAAHPAELERQIVSTGFFRQKSKALIGMAQALVAEHGGEVPPDMEKLTALPGVGRKTANVVLGHALGVPGLPVDRHVLRVSNRIGIAESDDPVTVEAQLCSALPKEMWTLASDVQILHGRRVCRPRPLCAECSVRDDCDYYRHVIAREPRPKLTAKGPRTKGAKTTKSPRNVASAGAARDVKPARTAKGTSTKAAHAIRPRTAATRSRAKRSN